MIKKGVYSCWHEDSPNAHCSSFQRNVVGTIDKDTERGEYGFKSTGIH